mmetsp:Transcript_11711/g.20822  ORF Transcript_11711/g.20822 Transcript_11711/m.20822 type:complete len:243 (+) Transcript_11711:726-1454(+)
MSHKLERVSIRGQLFHAGNIRGPGSCALLGCRSPLRCASKQCGRLQGPAPCQCGMRGVVGPGRLCACHLGLCGVVQLLSPSPPAACAHICQLCQGTRPDVQRADHVIGPRGVATATVLAPLLRHHAARRQRRLLHARCKACLCVRRHQGCTLSAALSCPALKRHLHLRQLRVRFLPCGRGLPSCGGHCACRRNRSQQPVTRSQPLFQGRAVHVHGPVHLSCQRFHLTHGRLEPLLPHGQLLS